MYATIWATCTIEQRQIIWWNEQHRMRNRNSKSERRQNITHILIWDWTTCLHTTDQVNITNCQTDFRLCDFVFWIFICNFIRIFCVIICVYWFTLCRAYLNWSKMSELLPYKIQYSTGNVNCTKCNFKVRMDDIQIAIMIQVNFPKIT